jgi:signal transduction histidine kinase
VSEKKVVSRSVALALGMICIVLTIGLVGGTAFYYLPQISSLNSQIDSLRSQINDMRVAELISFVQGAADYAAINGKGIALKEFSNNLSSRFIRGEFYIFAIDFNGVTLAQPYRPEDVGNSHLDLKDANEVLFFKNMLNTAKRGNGTLYYVWPNPAHNNALETKFTYVEKMDDTWFVGSGIYLSDVLVTFTETSRTELVSFVDSAVKYAQENGKDKALEAFNDKSGEFFKGNLYLFGGDFQGNQLLQPQQPEVVGTNRLDAVDPNGVRLVQDLVDVAKDGSGFTYYVYEDPAMNMNQRLKLSYVVKVDDTWWLGAGLYAL